MDWRERTTAQMLGMTVTVEVDRPIGYLHGDTVYPINYGYLPGVMGGDGEEQDAYILGVNEPVKSFTGRVVGVIRRSNDSEDKLVVAPEGMEYHQGEIAEATHFIEQYFVSTIDCLVRKSCGVVPYRIVNGEREYLILLQSNRCWSFPKGHMDAGETERETALRELREETGLTAALVPDVRVELSYDVRPLVRKEVVLFLGEVEGEPILQEREIRSHRWVKREELSDYLYPDSLAAFEQLLNMA